MRLAISIGCFFSLLLFAGCATSVKPSAASIAIPRAPSPIPVTVGISQVEQKLDGGFSDLALSVKKSLDESQLFKTIYYPVRPGDPLDGEIQLQLSSRMKMDGAWFPKAFFTGFFMLLPSPFVEYHHQYQAECILCAVRGGRTLKTYRVTSSVTATHKLWMDSPEELEANATQAAAKLMGAQVAQELINDRAFLERSFCGNAERGPVKP
jgi:hypothetical protein